ncbi:MAG: sigma-70 family RNA polymerase sigma factor [Phycisphaerales bacterium]|nr:sigma-70 family RNA polymerase sigma factor [Phycisphaerales bacterium]
MLDVTRTTTMLLEGLGQPDDDAAWTTVDRRYRPIVTGMARRLGLTDADAADVAQETMVRVLGEYRDGRYDRERGRLRTWILAIARTKIADIHRKRGVRKEARGESAILTTPTEAEMEDLWATERRMVILRAALADLQATSNLSARSIQAFEMLVFHKRTVEETSEALDMSANDVYLARSRITKKLREVVEQLESVYDEDGP